MTLTLGIAGCTGRMGLTLLEAAAATPGVTLTAGSERPGFSDAQLRVQLVPIGADTITLVDSPDALASAADAIIDFTSPASTLALAKAVATRGGIHIIGTTGFSAAELTILQSYGGHARIVMSGNFSPGVCLMAALVKQAAAALGVDYDIEITEMHHRHKKDAPSGTALMLGEAAADGRGVLLENHKVTIRDGHTGERKEGTIGFSVQRGGDVVGEHRVIFAGPGELIELRHQGFSRTIYAHGAIKAALWAKDQPAGFYTMQDVLGV